MDIFAGMGQTSMHTNAGVPWSRRDAAGVKRTSQAPGAATSGDQAVFSEASLAALQEPPSATPAGNLAISTAALRASLEKAWKALADDEKRLDIPGVEKDMAASGTTPLQATTQASAHGSAAKEYDGIPYITTELGAYLGGQSVVGTGNVDKRSERLKALMNGLDAYQSLELDRSMALLAGNGTLMGDDMLQKAQGQEQQSTPKATTGERESTDNSDENPDMIDDPGGIPVIPTALDVYGGGQAQVQIMHGRAEEHMGEYLQGIVEGARAEAELKRHQNSGIIDGAADDMEQRKKEEKASEEQATITGETSPGLLPVAERQARLRAAAAFQKSSDFPYAMPAAASPTDIANGAADPMTDLAPGAMPLHALPVEVASSLSIMV